MLMYAGLRATRMTAVAFRGRYLTLGHYLSGVRLTSARTTCDRRPFPSKGLGTPEAPGPILLCTYETSNNARAVVSAFLPLRPALYLRNAHSETDHGKPCGPRYGPALLTQNPSQNHRLKIRARGWQVRR